MASSLPSVCVIAGYGRRAGRCVGQRAGASPRSGRADL